MDTDAIRLPVEANRRYIASQPGVTMEIPIENAS
jgi:hypothetical protein